MVSWWFPGGFLAVSWWFFLVVPCWFLGSWVVSWWFPCGFLVVSLWFPGGSQLVSYGFPYGFLAASWRFPGGFLVDSWWFPCGFLVVSWWFPCGFLVVPGWFPDDTAKKEGACPWRCCRSRPSHARRPGRAASSRLRRAARPGDHLDRLGTNEARSSSSGAAVPPCSCGARRSRSSLSGAHMTSECKVSRRCSLPIERIDCASRAVDSEARCGSRRCMASSLCACAVVEHTRPHCCWKAAALRGGCSVSWWTSEGLR